MKNAESLSAKNPKFRIGEPDRVNENTLPDKMEPENITPNTEAMEALKKDV